MTSIATDTATFPNVTVKGDTVKVTGLTALNVRAIIESGLDLPVLDLGKTTATFTGTPASVTADMDDAIKTLTRLHGATGHPVASLHAVRRKLVRAIPA
ncbi:hypothetical protein SEA_LILBEANIE_8 [Gordonia phage Lilbeanie]|uniref:Uncharacterized protein n=1 Tax=Gordonia phage Lilbeanie TaxID=2794947 RepID=A0A7T1KS80_9CAUD|nr:hypothetical protein J1773_gp08 [Gordonia phage Lilbeanie]QPO17086.1 hypothetical protein SEA_LILBEANIE_8 [Gordonia phage Lilbeanie]